MRKTLLFGGILFVVIVGGAAVWKSTQHEAPVQEEKTVMPITAVTTTPVPSQSITTEPTPTPKTGVTPESTMKKIYTSPPPMTIDPNKIYTATIVTDQGSMTLSLFAKDTPVTVNNFVFLSRAGFYNATIFHRVIKGFMIQGGDPSGNGIGGPGYKFTDEPVTRDYTRGTIAMANSGPNTNGSQFFIMHETYGLPKQYVIFGAIDPKDSTSLATLDAIASASVTDNGMGEDSKPVTPAVVQSISIKEE